MREIEGASERKTTAEGKMTFIGDLCQRKLRNGENRELEERREKGMG